MAKKNTAGYGPRKVWSVSLAPLVTAAREGATQAAQTASRERARARRNAPWWRRRWLVATAAGLVVAGAAGGVYQAVAKRRTTRSGAGATGPGQEPGGGTPAQAIMSTVETGREKVAEAARTMLHKIRRDGSDGATPDRPEPARPGSPLASTGSDESRTQPEMTRR